MPDKIQDIIEAYHKLGNTLAEFENVLSKVDMEELKPAGQEFVKNMCFAHKRMHETHVIYESDVIESEAILTPKIIHNPAFSGLEVCGASR